MGRRPGYNRPDVGTVSADEDRRCLFGAGLPPVHRQSPRHLEVLPVHTRGRQSSTMGHQTVALAVRRYILLQDERDARLEHVSVVRGGDLAAAVSLSSTSTSVREPLPSGAVRHGNHAGGQLQPEPLSVACFRPRASHLSVVVAGKSGRSRLLVPGDDVAVRASTTVGGQVWNTVGYRNIVGGRRTAGATRNHTCRSVRLV